MSDTAHYKAQVAELLVAHPEEIALGFHLVRPRIMTAWKREAGKPRDAAAHILAYLVSLHHPVADKDVYEGERRLRQKSPRAQAYVDLLDGVFAWKEQFDSEGFFRVPEYPEGVEPVDPTVEKMHLPTFARLWETTEDLEHGALTVLDRLQRRLIEEYPDTMEDPLTVPPHVDQLDAALAFTGYYIRYIVSSAGAVAVENTTGS